MARNPLRLFCRGPEPDRSAAEPEWPPILLDDGWPDTGGGPATRAARPAPLRSPTDDPPTDPHGWPAVRDVDPPLDSAPLVSLPFTAPSPEMRLTQVAAARSLLVDRPPPEPSAGRPGPGPSGFVPGVLPWPPAEQAEAAGLAAAFAADFLSWDESDTARRGRVLAGYLGVPGPDPARLGWDGTGRQRAEFAVPGRVVVDGAGRLLVDVRVRVTPYHRVRSPAGDPDPEPEPAGLPAVAPAPTGRGWRGLASLWVRMTVPVVRDGPRLVVARWDEAVRSDGPPAEPTTGGGT